MPINSFDCIIIGAGAAGLVAAKELAADGSKVCILEAAGNSGGRIATIKGSFSGIAEAGAEFIHSPAPLTLQLLSEAGIEYKEVKGKMFTVKNGKWLKEEDDDEHWSELMKQLDTLQTDMTVLQFLQEYFPGDEYDLLKASVRRFAEGFDLADISNASVLSLKKEWNLDDERQYRIAGGYIRLIDYLLKQCKENGACIIYNQCVQLIQHSAAEATVITNTGERYKAAKIIITVPAGVLQSGDISFVPELTHHKTAIHQLGFGSVIKILLQFKNPFWNTYQHDIGFIFSQEEIPTWWTQSSAQSNMLTGWLGGVQARRKSSVTSDNILKLSLLSLSSIFNIPAATLYDHLSHYQVECWQQRKYIRGGYSYNTIYSSAAKIILNEPVNDVLFFAGEAMYDGPMQGTVEAALHSGKIAAGKVKKYQQQQQPSTAGNV